MPIHATLLTSLAQHLSRSGWFVRWRPETTSCGQFPPPCLSIASPHRASDSSTVAAGRGSSVAIWSVQQGVVLAYGAARSVEGAAQLIEACDGAAAQRGH